jgi:hypothetical protein
MVHATISLVVTKVSKCVPWVIGASSAVSRTLGAVIWTIEEVVLPLGAQQELPLRMIAIRALEPKFVQKSVFVCIIRVLGSILLEFVCLSPNCEP